MKMFETWIIVIIMFILIMLFEISKTFRYYLKMTVYFVAVNLMSIAPVVTGVINGPSTLNQRFPIWFTQRLKKLFGIQIELRGKEILESDIPYVIVCNHQSSVDFFGMMELWPQRCTVIAKKEILYAGIFGAACYYAKVLFLERRNHEKAKNSMNEIAKQVKKEKISVFVFPEGTRNRHGSMLPFKKGAFNLAVEAQVPIVPVVFSSLSTFYSEKEKRFDPGKFIITVMPKIQTVGLDKSDVPELSDKVRLQMLQVFNDTTEEVRGANCHKTHCR